MVNGVAMHLDFKASFVFKGKLLEVEAVSMICYGPLGERLKLNVWYDGQQIGNWSALRSYMGGGTNGIWPVIQDEDGVLFFTFNRKGMVGGANELLIEYYRTVVSDPIDVHSKDPRKYIPSKDLPDGFLSQQFELEELQSAKSIQWLIPVRDPSCNKTIGTLSCCAYPGYERYCKLPLNPCQLGLEFSVFK